MAQKKNVIPNLSYSIAEAKEEIKNGIRGYLAKNAAGEYICTTTARLPFYLEGAPGIGKTEAVKQIADELGIGFVSFSITHHTRNSLIGLPVIRDIEEPGIDGTMHKGKYTEYTMSEIIARPMQEYAKGHTEGILLLDEFNCASEILMPTMLAFLQTRNIGMYRLPDNWIIVLCGNPKEYNDSAKAFSAAILDRVRRISIRTDAKAFLSYADQIQMHPLILGFLKQNEHRIYHISGTREELQVVTFRGWENLSHMMKAYDAIGVKLTKNTVSQYIKSPETASLFYKYYRMNIGSFNSSNVADILAGKNLEENAKILEKENYAYRLDALELLESALLSSCKANTAKKANKEISNVFTFLTKLPDSVSLAESLFHFITDNDETLNVVYKIANEDYLDACRKAYGIKKCA